jgi:hypothetical protein
MRISVGKASIDLVGDPELRLDRQLRRLLHRQGTHRCPTKAEIEIATD